MGNVIWHPASELPETDGGYLVKLARNTDCSGRFVWGLSISSDQNYNYETLKFFASNPSGMRWNRVVADYNSTTEKMEMISIPMDKNVVQWAEIPV